MEPIIDLLIGFLSDGLEIAYNAAGPAEQEEILFGLPLLYLALETYGDRIVEATENPYDDKAVAEMKEAVMNIAEANGIKDRITPLIGY